MTRKKFTTTLDEQLIQQLKIQAVKESTNVSKILEKLISEYLEKKAQAVAYRHSSPVYSLSFALRVL